MAERTVEESWRILEFYSGIGGMRYSLMKAGINGEVVEAFDINDLANDVYKHNFGHRPFQGNIQSLSAAELEKYAAHAWLLSPPCQPYTRQGLQKHSADDRASSFIKILELIPQMQQPPMMLFVENVVGFEAKRKPLCFKNPFLNNQLLYTPIPLVLLEESTVMVGCLPELAEEWYLSCQPIRHFTETSVPIIEIERGCHDKDVKGTGDLLEKYAVPHSLIERWGRAMDIVYLDSKRCCCFTKSYYRYVKGTGSFLATTENSNYKPANNDGICSLKNLGLRYFTPREVANLHSFPLDFCFPEHISIKQQYALLGNSLSIAVVSPLLQYLFAKPPWHE